MIYQVWRGDCDECGAVEDYGEDMGTVPEHCETCGALLDGEKE